MADISTYQDVVDLVYSIIKDDADSCRLATTDQIDIWSNSSLLEMSEHAEYIDVIAIYAGDLTGVSTISTAEGAIGLWRVEIDDEAIPPITTRDLYKSSRTWQAQTGEPRWYYMDSMRTQGVDGFTVGLWPKPSADHDLRLIYTVDPDELSYANATDKVMLPLWATPGLVWGILARFYESESRMQNLGAARFYRMLFDQVMTRLRARSFSRTDRYKAWGEGRGRRIAGDVRNLMPADGFPYP